VRVSQAAFLTVQPEPGRGEDSFCIFYLPLAGGLCSIAPPNLTRLCASPGSGSINKDWVESASLL